MLIKKDSVILMNTRDKEVQYRSLDYLQEVTQIPFDFNTLQDLLIGNPIFFSDNSISYRRLFGLLHVRGWRWGFVVRLLEVVAHNRARRYMPGNDLESCLLEG